MALNYRKMSTARLEAKMANGSTAHEREMATREYGRRLDMKAPSVYFVPATKTNKVSIDIQIQGLVDKTVEDLSKVLARALTEALSQIRIPRS